MPNKVAVVTDSTAYLPEKHLKRYNISVTPLSVIWGEQDLLDGVDILPDEFYKRLANSKVMPTTSQVTPGAMHKIFQPLLDQGYDVLGIFITSKLSGTVQSALQVRDSLPNARDRIAIVDSLSTTMALGWPVLTAARAADAGESLLECQKVAENARDHTGVLFIVETLEFLRRGGRIGGAAAFMGTALNIKPVLEIRDGQIAALEKIRTKQKAIKRVVDIVSERIKSKAPIRLAVTHAASETDANLLLEAACTQLDPVETLCCPLSPVIGTHTGPGTIALNYMSGVA
ncbi:MAG: DegV family protein [Chloroflexota bacterium]|nr:DegV family protein [Anaerolineales bacterium]